MKKILLLCFILFFACSCGEKKTEEIPKEPVVSSDKTIEVVDIDSNTRPYAVVVNNSTAAVRVQTGLQQAYLVYEIPVEGGLTRLLALYKDVNDLTIGTIRSARHNFLDYVLENDAIFVCYGWSHYAKDDMTSLKNLDYMNGVVHSSPFWRDNPENLAREHTAYTSIQKMDAYVKEHRFKTITEKKIHFHYDDVDLSQDEHSGQAKKILIPSGNHSNTTYIYDEENKVYQRFVNGNENIDYKTKKQYTVKNIIVQKINTKMAKDNYYWDLETIGDGEGYYITNGHVIPITWKKASRNEKTCYNDLEGREIVLSDGNTFIQLQSTNQKLSIEG